MYEAEFERLLEEQRGTANGQRLELLRKDMTGERKLFCSVLYPVLQAAEGIEMEHEMMSLTGVRIYGDFFLKSLRMIIEADGYAVHAENITRDRFSFERMRIRTFAFYGYRYVPFSWDELDKKPDLCRRTLYELLGKYSTSTGDAFLQLSVYERELIRFALRKNGRLSLQDACYCLQLGQQPTRKVLRQLMDKQLLKPLGSGLTRYHEYELLEKATGYLLSH